MLIHPSKHHPAVDDASMRRGGAAAAGSAWAAAEGSRSGRLLGALWRRSKSNLMGGSLHG